MDLDSEAVMPDQLENKETSQSLLDRLEHCLGQSTKLMSLQGGLDLATGIASYDPQSYASAHNTHCVWKHLSGFLALGRSTDDDEKCP